jgi:transposase
MKKIKSKKVKQINKKTMVVSVDIGKHIHYGYFRGPNAIEYPPFSFKNSHKSFDQLWKKISNFKCDHDLDEIVIGFESTGPYAEPLFHFLRKKPVKLVQVNPVHTKRIKDLTGNSPNKTDKKDPRVIADVITLGHALTLIVPQGAAAHLRRLTQARERALRDRTATINQLQHLVFVVFPEFLNIMKNFNTKTAAYLLNHYPTPQDIVTLGAENLTKIIKKISRGRLRQERAQELIYAAKNTIGICEGSQSIFLEIAHLTTKVEHENRFIDTIENQLEEYLHQIPYSDSILSIKGIGVVTAAGLIGEVADFKKFDTISEIMKLAGFDLYEISSGIHRGMRRISKRGRPLIRKLLFFAAINAVKSKGIMHEPYKKMQERGMPKIKALVAISRKLLRIIYALARDDTLYMEDYKSPHDYKLAA